MITNKAQVKFVSSLLLGIFKNKFYFIVTVIFDYLHFTNNVQYSEGMIV